MGSAGDRQVPRPAPSIALAYAVAIALFWTLRLVYWQSVTEEPFSDMADYVMVANGIREHWTFSQTDFWQTYKLPVVPLLMAGAFTLAGSTDMDTWRLVQALLLFGSLAWLAREIYARSASHLLAVGLIACVALARSSIFWSYKAASESVAEAFVYAIAAAALHFGRARTRSWAFALGALGVAAVLARANLTPLVPLLGLTVVISARRAAASWNRVAALALAFTLGAAVAWAPWGIRNFRIYGTLVPISAQGPYSFLWELGSVRARLPDGTEAVTEVNALQREAAVRFRTDLEASRYAQLFVDRWLADNWAVFPGMVRERMWRQLKDRTEYLTRVPRENLFGVRPEPLLDKSKWGALLGLFGLLAFALRQRWFMPAALMPWLLWPFGALFLGYPRMFEPLVPMALFGVLLLTQMLYTRARSGRW